MELIIEEISRGQKLLHRHKCHKSHISVGRGYQNDIIISDPHVCSEHLFIEYNGDHWVIKDNNSLNGSFINHNKKSVLADEYKINSGDIITIGKSQIRFVFANHSVPESILYSPFERLIDTLRHPVIFALNILIFSAITAWMFYLNQPKSVNFTHLLVPTITAVMIFSIWPLGVALVSFLTKNDARALSQISISFLFLNLLYINDFIEKYLEFNFSSSILVSELIIIIPLIMTFCLFWFNCHIGFHLSNKRRIIVATCLTVLCFGGSHLLKLSKQPDFSFSPHYEATIMTPDFLLKQAITPSKFADDSRKLFTQTSQKAKAENLKFE